MLKINSLKKKKDFERVLKKGKGFRENFLFLKIIKNNLQISRFAFVVSKNFSKKASLRNKVRRRLRAIITQEAERIKPGFDGVLITRPGLAVKDFWLLKEKIKRLFKRAKILNEKDFSSGH